MIRIVSLLACWLLNADIDSELGVALSSCFRPWQHLATIYLLLFSYQNVAIWYFTCTANGT